MDEHCHKEIYSYKALKIALEINGFSLLELMIAMVVGLIIIGATYGVFISQNKEVARQDKIVEMQQNVRAAMDMMSREVRMAGYDPKGTAANAGITYSTTQLQIIADIDKSGVAGDAANENITYVYDATNKRITRNTGGGAQPFAENIAAFTFAYLKDPVTGVINPATTAAEIRQVRLTITGQTSAPINGSYPEYTLSADVYARNLAL